MKRALLTIVPALVLSMGVAGCQSSGDGGRGRMVPEPDPTRAMALPPTELAEGRRLSEIKCVKCHQFYNPKDYGRTEWDLWMKKMSRKAHLTDEEQRVLSHYLELFRPAS